MAEREVAKPLRVGPRPSTLARLPDSSADHGITTASPDSTFSRTGSKGGHCCYAWNRLIDQPWIIMSIGLRDWANA
jgi:hypothetical protein